MSYRLCAACRSGQIKGNPNRIITVCKSLGEHLVHSELSAVIEQQVRQTTSARFPQQQKECDSTKIGTSDNSNSTDGQNPQIHCLDLLHPSLEHSVETGKYNDCSSGRSNIDNLSDTLDQNNSSTTESKRTFATDCKTKHKGYVFAEKRKPKLGTNVSRKRKHVVQYTDHGYSAMTKFTKFGDDTLLSLCAPQDNSHERLTIESYREQMEDIIKQLNRGDLLPMLQRTRPLLKDLVEQYYTTCKDKPEQKNTKRVLRSATRQQSSDTASRRQSSRLKALKMQPVTCEVKMRVRIQYKSHRHLLTGIESVKESREERQLDRFFQASNIMRSRDTGCVVCNISFSDITYLGAFWRDYSNGALQEALRGVFLTEMMRSTAGDEELDLFVSVDEKDFRNGQKLLVKNLESGNNDSSAVTGISIRGQVGVATTARVEHI